MALGRHPVRVHAGAGVGGRLAGVRRRTGTRLRRIAQMSVDTLVVFGIVAAAVAFTARRAWKALRPARKTGCGSDCGCGH
ncbi:MAG: hypothetical protein C0516_15975 [Gemmatimonas sp.]|nr:hypothetical protein [Gemmatimonas sp.]